MSENIRNAGVQHVDMVSKSNRLLIEKALDMRCQSYLANVKAQLLTQTIFEVQRSRKGLLEINERLSSSLNIIETKKAELEREVKNRKRIENILAQIALGISIHEGTKFFNEMTQFLVRSLDFEHVLIGQLNKEKDQIESLSYNLGGSILQNQTYSTTDTPCEKALSGRKTVTYNQQETKKFGRLNCMDVKIFSKYFGVPLLDQNGLAIGLLVAISNKDFETTDISKYILKIISLQLSAQIERHRFKERLNMAASVFDYATEGIMVTDEKNHIIEVNKAFESITGFSKEEVLGKDPKIMASGRQDRSFYQRMWADIKRTGHWSGELWDKRKSGEVYAVWLSVATLNNQNGEKNHVGYFFDITERIERETLIRRQANYDELTQLPNRYLFYDRLATAISRCARSKKPGMFMFIDVDFLKKINDSFGHHEGDNVLVETAQRLKRLVRAEDTVARLGGDEFTVIIEDLNTEADINLIPQKVIAAFEQPYLINGKEIIMSASIGVALFPNDSSDADLLITQADSAMYLAKKQGRNRYQFFNDSNNDY